MIFTILTALTLLAPGPDLTLKKNRKEALPEKTFYHSTNGEAAKQRTKVNLLYSDDTLHVTFECLDNPFHELNTYKEYNSPMFRQEVFELFISEGGETPGRYLELEINPNNALFAAWIDNPTFKSVTKGTKLAENETGIRHTAAGSGDLWKGEIHIPLNLIGKQQSDLYRLNFYRIALFKKPETTDWNGSVANCDYMCWRSTMSGKSPNFHRPESFGMIRLKK